MPSGPVLPPGAATLSTPPGPDTVGQVCLNALYELNVVAPGEPADPAEIAFALSKFNQIYDSWNTQQIYIFSSDLIDSIPVPGATLGNAFLLTPGLSPHTIGPGGNAQNPLTPNFLLIGERPVRLVSCNILLTNVSPTVRFPLTPHDKDWWAKQRVQNIQTALPTDYYYRPDWPLGAIFFWPVPNYAYQVEFEIETILQGAVALNQQFWAPPGYELAMTLTLAEQLQGTFERFIPDLPKRASQARLAIQGVNATPPRINLDDFGRPSSERPRASFNYHTGLDR